MNSERPTELHILKADLAFPESPRWHDGRLWVSDWGAQQVLTVDLEGRSEVVARVESLMCIHHLPDGRLLVVSSTQRRLLRREPDGSLVTHGDLGALGEHPWNDLVVDGRGNAYVNNIGFDFPAGEVAPGFVALVSPDGTARQVADGLAFPNGMAVTPDNATLIVAESYGRKLTAFRHRRRRRPVEPPDVGRGRRPPRRHLPGRRRRHLVRRRGQQALRARA